MINKQMLRCTIQTKAFAVAVASVASAAAGASASFLILRKSLEKKYADLADQEIAAARTAYAKRYKAEEYADLLDNFDLDHNKVAMLTDEPEPEVEAEISEEDIRATALTLMEKAEYTPYNTFAEKPPAQTEKERIEVVASQRRNLFDNQPIVENEEFDPAKELEKKAASRPYILEHDVFYDNDLDREQYVLTYYEEDDVLVDDHGRAIPNKESAVGVGNLRFGYGTHQKDVVLIHNPVLNVDYEVNRDNGSYAREILGYEAPEERQRPRRFRDDD